MILKPSQAAMNQNCYASSCLFPNLQRMVMNPSLYGHMLAELSIKQFLCVFPVPETQTPHTRRSRIDGPSSPPEDPFHFLLPDVTLLWHSGPKHSGVRIFLRTCVRMHTQI